MPHKKIQKAITFLKNWEINYKKIPVSHFSYVGYPYAPMIFSFKIMIKGAYIYQVIGKK